MKKRSLFVATVAILLCAFFPFRASASSETSGNNDLTMVPRVSEFDKVKVSGEFVVIYCAPSETLRIEGKRKVLDNVECFVQDRELVVKFIKGQTFSAIMSGKAPTVYIPSSSAIDGVVLNGASSFRCECPIESDKFEFDVSGAASIDADVKVNELELDCSGAASVTVVGIANKLEMDISGASTVNAITDFVCTTADIDLSGSSVVRVNCSEKISGKISGASIVKYDGAAEIAVKTNGLSAISSVR